MPSDETSGWVDAAVEREVGVHVRAMEVLWSGAGVVVVLADTPRGPVLAVHPPHGEPVTRRVEPKRRPGRVAVEPHPADGWEAPERTLEDLDLLATYRDELAAAGILVPAALASADPHVLARATGAPVATVKRWQAAAELLALPSLDPRDASTLALVGVDGVTDLARRSAPALAEEIERRRELDAPGRVPLDEAAVAVWIEDARAFLRDARALHGAA